MTDKRNPFDTLREDPFEEDDMDRIAKQQDRFDKLNSMDAWELRQWTADLMAAADEVTYNENAADIAWAIDRMAALTGSLPRVLRDLADDVEMIRGGESA